MSLTSELEKLIVILIEERIKLIEDRDKYLNLYIQCERENLSTQAPNTGVKEETITLHMPEKKIYQHKDSYKRKIPKNKLSYYQRNREKILAKSREEYYKKNHSLKEG